LDFFFVVGTVLSARPHELENGPSDAFEAEQKAGSDIERINAVFAEPVKLGVVAAPGGLGNSNGIDWQSKANLPGRVVEESRVGQSVAQVPGRVVDPANEGNREILQGLESLKSLPPDWERELDGAPTPTKVPTSTPTSKPSKVPTNFPTFSPTRFPTKRPRKAPTRSPTCHKGMKGLKRCMMMM
jgi:hypothetical protein